VRGYAILVLAGVFVLCLAFYFALNHDPHLVEEEVSAVAFVHPSHLEVLALVDVLVVAALALALVLQFE
jgi:hypothetical protein